MYETRQFRKGLKVEIDGTPFQIVDFQHVSPGKGSAFTRTKLKNMINGNVVERTFRSGEKVDRANTDDRDMQFLYQDGDGYHFMNMANYEQTHIADDVLADAKGYLSEGLTVNVTFYNDRPIGVDLPNFVVLEVAETEPAFKGDTVSGTKPAKMTTGVTVGVPFHIKEGDKVKVDTRTNTYVEKA